ncbi:hypothetical protein KR018_001254 [Drosophila ironensis]|nr:hypothetical protein KR018_001254 [Drosophila ironensis]
MNLGDLLQRAQSLSNETNMETDVELEMPRVERTISQVLQATQELHSRVTQKGTNDLQAHILMGSKGVDLPRLTQKLDSLSARKSFEPLNPILDTDVPGYLKNERENTILSVIDEINRGIFESVERQKWRCAYTEWGDDKQSLLNALVGPGQQDFPDRPLDVGTNMCDAPDAVTLARSEMKEQYAAAVKGYNQGRIANTQTETLMSTFKNMAQKFEDEHAPEMWHMLDSMSKVPPNVRTGDPLEKRQKAPQFVQQARAYLERRYKIYMDTIVRKNLLRAERGGVPNVRSLVKSFVSVQFQSSSSCERLMDIDNGTPLWPLVYYSLRTGDLGSAISFLATSGAAPDLHKLMVQLKEGGNSLAAAKMETALTLEYNNQLKVCTDPFKKAVSFAYIFPRFAVWKYNVVLQVYAVILACDPQDGHNELMRTIDDFLWLQLSILRRPDQLNEHADDLTFTGLQKLVLEEYGEKYFNARERAPLYFQVLVLTGQFEAALEFLARSDATRVHAVHMAMALNELGLLGVPRSVQATLLSEDPDDGKPMKRLNLVRLIVMYAKCFEEAEPDAALQYYYLLRNFKDDHGNSVMMNCLSDLLMDNCTPGMLRHLFGKEDKKDPTRYVGGVFFDLFTKECDKRSLANQVASQLAKCSNFEMAIRLYLIAGNLEDALQLICSLMSQVVHQPLTSGSLRERLNQLNHKLEDVLAGRKNELDANTMITYTTLTQLMKFFDLLYSNESRSASQILVNNRFIPTSSEDVEECVANLKRMGPEVIRVLPDVMLAAMNIIYDEFVQTRGSSNSSDTSDMDDTNSEGQEAAMLHLRQRAKALTNMAASVPYRLPNQTNQRLVQLEILMH